MKQGEVARMFEADWMSCSGGGELGRLDGDFIVQTAKGDIEQLRKLVPAPLEATEDVIVYTARFKETIDENGDLRWPFPFHEWGIGVRARLKDSPENEGNFLVQLYVDNDLVLVHGREVWGYPKKIGKTEISDTSVDSARYDYSVERQGATLVTGHVDNLAPISVDEFPFSGTAYNICYRQIPAVDRVGIEKQELVFVKLDLDATETKKGDSAISIQDGPYDQIPIGPLTDVTGYFGRVSMYHHGVSPLVVEATERARPIDYSRIGKALQAV
jgi:acetoacetate decarboxylase